MFEKFKGKSCDLDKQIEIMNEIREIRDRIIELKLEAQDMKVADYQEQRRRLLDALQEQKERLHRQCGVKLTDEQVFGEEL